MEQNSFNYTYSCNRDDEVIKIKNKYKSKSQKELKVDELIRLDKSTMRSASVITLAIGIISTLIFGMGLSLILVWPDHIIYGVSVGVMGLILVSINYPIYLKIVDKKQKAIAPQILKLTDEIEKGVY